ncbi:MAG: hypothetical protein IJL06_08760 [Kiritimatiellae bacterium]|nr:hypothetical protein [Kiritimatiellia bacterium]
MLKKIKRYAIVLVAGCVLIWVGLWAAKKFAPPVYYKIAANVTGRDFVVPGTVDPVVVTHPFWRGANLKDIQKKIAETAETAGGKGTFSSRAKKIGGSLAAGASSAVAAVTGGEVTETADGGGAAEEPVDEGPDPRAAKNADPGYPWGVLVRNADFFDPQMKKLGTLPAGSVVEHMTVVQKPEGEVVSCRVLRNLEWKQRAVVFFTADLVRFQGVTYADAPRKERDVVIDYCTAAGKLESLRAAQQPKRGKNPYEAEYQAAKAKHDAFQKHVNEVNSKIRWANTHDLPGGPTERARLLQEGRVLRGQQATEDAAFKPIRDKWTDWERKHPEQPWRPVKETPEMKELQKIVDKLRPTVVQLCPGI